MMPAKKKDATADKEKSKALIRSGLRRKILKLSVVNQDDKDLNQPDNMASRQVEIEGDSFLVAGIYKAQTTLLVPPFAFENLYKNYEESDGTKEFEVLIVDKALNTTDVYMQFSMPLMEGPITIYKGITCDVQYAPESFNDVSMLKQVTESTVIFEDTNFSRATVGFRTDLSPGYETIDFTKSGKGDFGFFVYSQHNWGGGFSGVPLRTYIPRQKQRCRYIQLEFLHDSAREKFTLYGFSYTFRPISERAYRS